MPDIEVNLPDVMPKVIDLTSLGPKKVYNITLPQVRWHLVVCVARRVLDTNAYGKLLVCMVFIEVC
jgi:hypothetical protein